MNKYHTIECVSFDENIMILKIDDKTYQIKFRTQSN